MMQIRTKVIVGTIGAMAGLGGTGVAHADAYAFARNQITGFAITSTAVFSFIGIATRDTITTAQFNGFPVAGDTDPVVLGNASNAFQAMAGPGPFPAENTFTQTAGIIGARGDAFVSAGSPFGAGGVPNVNNVAEGRALSGSGQSGASAGRNTADAALRVTTGGTFTFSFTDSILLRAEADMAGETANASIANEFSIISGLTGLVVYRFAPNGVLDAGETSDPFSLQQGCGSNSGVPSGGCLIGPSSGFFSGTSGFLAAGDYSITLRTASQENVVTRRAVPEPTSLLLAGAALLGLSIARRRNSA